MKTQEIHYNIYIRTMKKSKLVQCESISGGTYLTRTEAEAFLDTMRREKAQEGYNTFARSDLSFQIVRPGDTGQVKVVIAMPLN